MKCRFDDRILARELRSRGRSFSEIMAKIPNLPKGTLNGWLKDIELTREQKLRLLEKVVIGGQKGRKKARLLGAFRNHEKRILITKQIIKNAQRESSIRVNNSFFVSGVMLYWAEGYRSTSAEQVNFTNSDPRMIRFMMKWFREICFVPENKFKIRLQLMILHNEEESLNYWSKVTSLPYESFGKLIIKPTPLKGKRNPSYRGTCSIEIYDKNLFRKIMGWKSGVLDSYKIFAPVA